MRTVLLMFCLLPSLLQAGEEPPEEVVPEAAVVAEEVAPAPVSPESREAAAAEPEQEPQQATAVLIKFGPYKARFSVNYNGIKVGEMTQRLTKASGGRQTMHTEARTTGLVSWFKSDTITERSIWREEGGMRMPISYTYRYTGRSKEVFERLDFDWEKGVVESLREGKVTVLEVERGTLDKHMVQLVLRQALFGDERHFSYPVADRSKLEQYQFELEGEGVFESDKLGKLHCLKVRRGDTLFWVARKFDYLPVRIEKMEDDNSITSELIEYQGG